MTRRVFPEIPVEVECPQCGRLAKTVCGKFARHSVFPTGPQCTNSTQPVTDEAVSHTAHLDRMKKVLMWAHMLRDEDPRHVTTWVKLIERRELELLLLTALAAVPADSTLETAFGWVRGLEATA